jgi:hypothetical protein
VRNTAARLHSNRSHFEGFHALLPFNSLPKFEQMRVYREAEKGASARKVRKTWCGIVVDGAEMTQFNGSLIQAATPQPQHKLDQKSQNIPGKNSQRVFTKFGDKYLSSHIFISHGCGQIRKIVCTWSLGTEGSNVNFTFFL